MSQHARVRSIDALSRLRAAIGVFAEEAEQALVAVDSEIARTQRVVGEEMPRYWQGELRKREEDVVRARIALEQALARREMGKSSVDERKALARAKQRVETARARLAASNRWRRELQREQLLYSGSVEPLARFARATAPQAEEALRRMIDSLEQYVSIAPATSEELDTEPQGPPDVRRATRAASSPHAGACGHGRLALVGARLPTEDQAAGAPDGSLDDLPAFDLTIDDRKRLAALGAGDSPDPRQSILVADTARTASCVALHRTAPAGPGDSGWRALGLDEREPVEWRRVPILAILRSRPASHDLLRLPAGWAVVLAPADEHPVKAARDPSGTDRWGSMREHPE